ncbi:MAG: response regulator [Planctomycetales bacterium]|nr:response regulator [Planctomycetales bacterium]
MAKSRVLIVEDDEPLADVLQYNFEKEGFAVTRASDGAQALRRVHESPHDIVILDLMLPEIDGIEVCRQLRANPKTQNILVIMLTAKAEEIDELVGFTVGADDYVTKPFSVNVLMRRVRALQRRQDASPDDRDVIVSQGVMVDCTSYRVRAGDEDLSLTKSEFALLDTLIRNPGRVYSRAELINSALGGDAIVLERTIDVHIRAVRKKLGAYAPLIETVRGVGYRFRDGRSSYDDL